MAATDAIPVPRKNTAYRFYFAIRKPSDSTLITGWTGADSEVSLDGGAYADCTNEATEIGTSGCGYIDLTSSEMNADCTMLKITVTNTGAVPLVFALYPESAGDYRVADTQKVDVNTIKTNPVVNGGTITFPTDATLPTAADLATLTGYVDTEVAAIKAKTDNLPASPAATGDIPSAATVADAVWDEAMSGHTTSGTYGGRIPRSDSSNVNVKLTGSAHIAADIHELQPAVIESTHFAADAIDSNAVAATAVTEIQSGLATASALSTVGTNVSTAVTQTTASSIRSAVGLATDNLDTQLAAIPTTIRVKKNTALAGFQIVMLNSTTSEPATGATVTGTVSKDGAAFGALTNSVTEIGSGAYTVDLAAGDTNGNNLLYKFAATGCKTLFVRIVTQP